MSSRCCLHADKMEVWDVGCILGHTRKNLGRHTPHYPLMYLWTTLPGNWSLLVHYTRTFRAWNGKSNLLAITVRMVLIRIRFVPIIHLLSVTKSTHWTKCDTNGATFWFVWASWIFSRRDKGPNEIKRKHTDTRIIVLCYIWRTTELLWVHKSRAWAVIAVHAIEI